MHSPGTTHIGGSSHVPSSWQVMVSFPTRLVPKLQRYLAVLPTEVKIPPLNTVPFAICGGGPQSTDEIKVSKTQYEIINQNDPEITQP